MAVTIREFWSDAGLYPRFALLVAGISLGLNVGTYAGLRARGPLMGLYVIHIVVMFLGFGLFAIMAYANVGRFRGRFRRGLVTPAKPPLPGRLIAGVAVSGLYTMALFVYAFAAFGEGSPEVQQGRDVWVKAGQVVRDLGPGEARAFERLELRVFSAGWLFFSLVIALASPRALARARLASGVHQGAAT